MAFGDSEISPGQVNCNELTAGIGQGNGDGPTHMGSSEYTFIQNHEGGRTGGTIYMFTVKALVGLAFVDNTDLVVNMASNQVEQVSTKMQQLLTMWHGLLQAMGGELVPEK